MPTPFSCPLGSWRKAAANIVEELFPVTNTDHWNRLLDLRTGLLTGDHWEKTLDLFLECRAELEADHYLPFYRLRRLLSNSLSFEAANPVELESLEALLRLNHRNWAQLKQSIDRHVFEHAPDFEGVPELRWIETA